MPSSSREKTWAEKTQKRAERVRVGMKNPATLRRAQQNERSVVQQRYGRDLPYYWGDFVVVRP